MALDILPHPTTASVRLAPVEPRYAALFAFFLVAIGCALAGFVLDCETPFPAFAVIAAAMLPLQSALLIAAAAWLVNQGIGFGFLGFAADANTVLLGPVIGIAVLLATATSVLALRAARRAPSPVALGFALIGAYAVYEGVSFAATPLFGAADGFTVAILSRHAALDALWLIGLVAACEVFRLLDPLGRRRIAS